MSYPFVVDVDDVGLPSIPFPDDAILSPHDRLWLGRGNMPRGQHLNRYSGEIEHLTEPVGFGDGSFGNGIFGWS